MSSTETQPTSRLHALIQIIKVNDLREGEKDGRKWAMQDAECLLLNDDGTPASVGVLSLPKSLMGENAPKNGTYSASFSLVAGMRDRKIEARLVGLVDASARLRSSSRASASA